MIFTLFFFNAVGMVGNFFLVTNRQYLYLGCLLSGVVINLILGYIFLKLGLGIVGVAIGASISYFFFFSVMIILLIYYCKEKIKEGLKLVAEIMLPLIYVLLVSLLIEKFIVIDGSNILGLAKDIIVKELVFLALSSWLGYLFLKKIGFKKLKLLLLWIK